MIFLLASCFYLYEFALQVATSVMTHQLMADFNIDAAGLGAMSAYFYYAYTPMQLPGGLLYDRFDARKVMTIAIIITALGAVFFSRTHSVTIASMARFMMGFGSAFSFVGVLVLITHWFDKKYFALLAGIAQLMSSIGAICGQMPLGKMVHSIGWRDSMLALGLMGIGLAILVWFFVHEAPGKKEQRSKVRQRREPEMQRVKAVLGRKKNWSVALFSFTIWAPMVVFAALWGVPFLIRADGYTLFQASAACAMIWIGVGIGSPALGWWSEQIGDRRILLIISGIIGFVASLFIIYANNLHISIVYFLLFLYGFSCGSQALTFAVIKDNNPIKYVGTATGFNNAAVVAGGALLQPLSGYILRFNWEHHYGHGVPIYSTADYHGALILVPISFLIATLTAIFLIHENYGELENHKS